LGAAEQARRDLKACPARMCEVGGRLNVHFADYVAWECRSIPGDLGAGLYSGLWVEGWNAWAQDPAVQRDGLAGLPVGLLPHPCLFVQDKDFIRFGSIAESETALEKRSSGLTLKIAAALVKAGKTPGYWPFSDNQKKILDALDGRVLTDVELAL